MLLPLLDEREVATTTARLAVETLHAARARVHWWAGVQGAGASHIPHDRFAGAYPPHTPQGRDAGWSAAHERLIDQGAATFLDQSSGDAVAPVCADGTPLAVLVVTPEAGSRFDESGMHLLDRIAPIAGIALRNARRLLDERSRADAFGETARLKSQFLNLAAHELRGPMTVLMGYLSLLEDGAFGPLPEEFAGTFPLINARIAEMEGLINAMLETSRLEDNRLDLQLADIDLVEVVDDAVSRSEVFAYPGQKVLVDHPSGPLGIRADRGRMTVAVANLVQNALKFSVQRTDVRVVLTENGQRASVVVIDTGIGIAAEDMPILFTRFGRIRRNPAASGIPGTGLGLYLARELSRAHQGDVTAVSTLGSGSTFTLTLPLPGP
jgi:signal transduction histidine kinase